MKTRRFDRGLRSALLVLALVAAGCGATSVKEKAGVTNEAPAVAGETATNGPLAEASAPPASVEEAKPVQRSLRPNAPLPDEITRVVQLVESGAGEEVVRAFVGASNARYELSLDQIIYLRDIGITDGVIAAMMRRGSELREKDADNAAMQTNLVTAVEQIKEGLATSQAGQNGAAAPAPVSTVTTAAASETGVPEGTPEAASAAPGVPGAAVAAPVAVQAAQVPAEAPQAVQQFYTPLASYGTWYQVPTYGWVWQPSVVVVDSGWMPYRHGGRWVWSDCGWYWCSDYSWGWAPFHYGRWCTYPGIGWCWVPDTVWGPSWVTWRHCDSHIGWAPLPPACGWSSGIGLTWHGGSVAVGFGFGLTHHWYTFVPSARFCHRNVGHHAVRGGDHDGAFRRSTVVNNVIVGNNNTIVNNGIGYTTVASKVRDEIPKARVEPLPNESRTTLRADRLERSKDGFVVYRPTPVESAGGRPAALRSEVRPVASSLASPTRAGAGVPGRPSMTSRFANGAGTPGKAVETRGGGGSVPAAVGGGATPSVRTPTVAGRPVPSATPRPSGNLPTRETVRPYSSGVTRSGEVPSAASGSPGSAVPRAGVPNAAPSRQNPAVPMSDPTRNIPTRSGEPVRSPGSVGGRPTMTAPSAPLSGSAPNPGTVLPRGGYSAPAPSANIPRPTAPAPMSAPNMGAPSRPTYSAPAAVPNVSRPTFSAPSPSYGAPQSAPAMSAPRPSYSAPAPSAAPPRPTFSAPSPAAPAPSPAPAPAGGGGGRGNPRTQQN